MAQVKPRHAGGAVAPANRVPRPLRGRLAALAGTLILAALGAWIFGRRRGGAAQPAGARAPERTAQPAAAAIRQLAPAGSAAGDQVRTAASRRPPGSPARRSYRARRLARWLPVALGALAALALGGWIFIAHGDMLVMQTPSMGTTAPAGSLVLTRPIGAAPLRRGMVVAFHVPSTGAVYMHRVAQLLPGGAFRTRGDLNTSDDGWELTRTSIIGVPVAIIPDLGWVVNGLPWALAVLAAGAILSLILPRFLRPAMRSVTVGGAFALPLYMVRPFVRVAVASAGRVTTAAAGGHSAAARGAHHGGVTMAASSHSGANFLARLVNGGVLPLRISITGTHTVIEPGHAGIIAARLASHANSTLQAHAILPAWAWVLVGAIVLSPLAVGMLALREGPATVAQDRPRRRRLSGSMLRRLSVGREAAEVGG